MQCHTSSETQQLVEAVPSPQLDLALLWTHASRCLSLHVHVCVGATVMHVYMHVHGACVCTVLYYCMCMCMCVYAVSNVDACVCVCTCVYMFYMTITSMLQSPTVQHLPEPLLLCVKLSHTGRKCSRCCRCHNLAITKTVNRLQHVSCHSAVCHQWLHCKPAC